MAEVELETVISSTGSEIREKLHQKYSDLPFLLFCMYYFSVLRGQINHYQEPQTFKQSNFSFKYKQTKGKIEMWIISVYFESLEGNCE